MNENINETNELMETEVEGFEVAESDGKGDLVVIGAAVVAGALLMKGIEQIPKGYRWVKSKIQDIRDRKKNPDNIVDGEFETVDEEFDEAANS